VSEWMGSWKINRQTMRRPEVLSAPTAFCDHRPLQKSGIILIRRSMAEVNDKAFPLAPEKLTQTLLDLTQQCAHLKQLKKGVLEVNVILCFFQKRHQLLAEDDEGCPQVRRRK